MYLKTGNKGTNIKKSDINCNFFFLTWISHSAMLLSRNRP